MVFTFIIRVKAFLGQEQIYLSIVVAFEPIRHTIFNLTNQLVIRLTNSHIPSPNKHTECQDVCERRQAPGYHGNQDTSARSYKLYDLKVC